MRILGLRKTDMLFVVAALLLAAWTPAYANLGPEGRDLAEGVTITTSPPREGDAITYGLVIEVGEDGPYTWGPIYTLSAHSPTPEQAKRTSPSGEPVALVITKEHHGHDVHFGPCRQMEHPHRVEYFFDSQGKHVWTQRTGYDPMDPTMDLESDTGNTSAVSAKRGSTEPLGHPLLEAGQQHAFNATRVHESVRQVYLNLHEQADPFWEAIQEPGDPMDPHRERSNVPFVAKYKDELLFASPPVMWTWPGHQMMDSSPCFRAALEGSLPSTGEVHSLEWNWLVDDLPFRGGGHVGLYSSDGEPLLRIQHVPLEIHRGQNKILIEDEPPNAVVPGDFLIPSHPDAITIREIVQDETRLTGNITVPWLLHQVVAAENTSEAGRILSDGGYMTGLAWTRDPSDDRLHHWLLAVIEEHTPTIDEETSTEPQLVPVGENMTPERPVTNATIVHLVTKDNPLDGPRLLDSNPACEGPPAPFQEHALHVHCGPGRAPSPNLRQVLPPSIALETLGAEAGLHQGDPVKQPGASDHPLMFVWTIVSDEQAQHPGGPLDTHSRPTDPTDDVPRAPLWLDRGAYSHEQRLSGFQPMHDSRTMRAYLVAGTDADSLPFQAVRLDDGVVVSSHTATPHGSADNPTPVGDPVPASHGPSPVIIEPLGTHMGLAALGFVVLGVLLRVAGWLWIHGHFTFLLAGYARLTGNRVLDHERRSQIMSLVEADPGVTRDELKQILGFSNGVLVHHLAVLAREGLIDRRTLAGAVHWFPCTLRDPKRRDRIAAMRHRKLRRILLAVETDPGITLSRLTNQVEAGKPAVSRLATRLARLGIVAKERDGRVTRFFPVVLDRPESVAHGNANRDGTVEQA